MSIFIVERETTQAPAKSVKPEPKPKFPPHDGQVCHLCRDDEREPDGHPLCGSSGQIMLPLMHWDNGKADQGTQKICRFCSLPRCPSCAGLAKRPEGEWAEPSERKWS